MDLTTQADNDIRDVYLDSLLEQIQTELNNKFKDIVFIINSNKEKKSIFIKIKLKKLSSTNQTTSDIHFYISLTHRFPQVPPIVQCHSNFCFPTLFDNRNLLSSLLNYPWQTNSKISDIVTNLPLLVSRSLKDSTEKILTFYGDYNINEIYDINEFIINREIFLFKCFVDLNDKAEDRYIIITDIFILIFIPVIHLKYYAKLIFISELNELQSFKVVKEISDSVFPKTGVILEWENNNNSYTDVIIFENDSISWFKTLIKHRVKKFSESFLFITEDIKKQSSLSLTTPKPFNFKRMNDFINYKEKCYEEEKNNEIKNELMLLYQKMVEVLSGGSGEEYLLYMNKLKRILEN